MNQVLPSVITLFAFSLVVFQSQQEQASSTKVSAKPLAAPAATTFPEIARQTKQGTTVQINQIQIQRIVTKPEATATFAKLGVDVTKYQRTIAVSVSQTGNGKSLGPFRLRLKDGTLLNVSQSSNQILMNAMVNATVPQDHSFMEVWFALPQNLDFEKIFPVSVVLETTNAAEKPLKFKFENITP